MILRKRLARDSLVHFMTVGSLIYGAFVLLKGEFAENSGRMITVTLGEIKALIHQSARARNRLPSESEDAVTLRSYVRTRILYREAIAMGLDRKNQVIECRLAQKLEFFSPGLVEPQPLGDEVLGRWYAENGERFREPGTDSSSQLFFNLDRRDDAVGNALSALAQLRLTESMPEDPARYGDNSILGRYYSSHDEVELRKLFGSDFVEHVLLLQPGMWHVVCGMGHGPVFSGHGVHLVYVHDVVKPRARALEDIREEGEKARVLGQVDELSALFIGDLIARYEVVVALPVAMTPPSPGAGE